MDNDVSEGKETSAEVREKFADLRTASDGDANSEKGTKDHFKPKNLFLRLWCCFVQAFIFVKSLKLELISFLYTSGYMLKIVTLVTLLMERVCKVNLRYGDTVCNNLENYTYEKTEVERMANNYHLGGLVIGILPACILSCFIGPWSDSYGRRFPIMIALIGIIVDDGGTTIWSYITEARAAFSFIPPVFSGITGGLIVALTVIYSYASDTTPTKFRTVKYALLEASIGLAVPFGTFSGGIIFRHFGYAPVFATSFVLHAFSLLFVFLLMKETRGLGNQDSWKKKIKVFFTTKNLTDAFRTAIKKRPYKGRLQLWMILIVMGLSIFMHAGSSQITYLFTHHHYNWGNMRFSTVSSIFAVMSIVAMMITVPIFTKVFHVSDPVLGIIGGISSLGKQLCIAFAASKSLFYLGNLLSLLSSLTNLAGRSRLSKLVPKSDIGKVFALLSTVEYLIPVVATFVISQLFNATVGIIPDPTFTFLTVCAFVMLGNFTWMFFLPKVNYDEIQEQEERMSKQSEAPVISEEPVAEA